MRCACRSNSGMPQKMVDILTSNLELDQNDVYRVDGPLDLSRAAKRCSASTARHLNDKPFIPSTPKGFTGPRRRNLHHHSAKATPAAPSL